MAEPTKQTIPGLANTVQGAINSFDDLADTIANPNPDKPLRNAIGVSGRRYCDFIGAVPNSAFALLGPGFALSGLLCQPYWADQGYDPPVAGSPPFTGGQCATSYSVPIWVRQVDGSEGVVTNLSVTGPITSITRTLVGFETYRFDVVGAGGSTSSTTQPNLSFGAQPRSGFYDPVGTPNNCGDPAGIGYAPGANPPPDPGPFPTGFEPGTNPDGQPYFFIPPIDSPIPGGDPYDVPALPSNDSQACPVPDGGEAGTPIEPAAGAAAEGEADEGQELVGVLVSILSTPPNANKFDDIPVDVWRGSGYVRMGYPGRLGCDQSAGTAQNLQFYHAQQRGLTAFEVRPRNGFNIRVTPYFRSID